MRQTGILPAGLNTHSNLYVTHISSKFLYYASTVAINIYSLENFSLLNVVTIGDSTITTFSVSPANENVLIIGYINGMIYYYDVAQQKVINNTQGPSARATIMLCTPHDPNICVIIDNRTGVLNRVVSWIYQDENNNTNAINRHKNLHFKEGIQVNVARWHPHIHSYLALGCSNGEVYLFNYERSTKKIFSKKDGNNYNVVDVQWDRLSSVYLLVAYSNFISLWDTETQSEINVFDKQPTGISSVSWMDWTAGNFISSNVKNGTLKIWNVSQKAPLDSIRIGDVGIQCMRLGPGTKQCVCSHVDGSVSVFHLEKKHLDFVTGYGHTETIFDCKFSPLTADTFATGSYDGTLKLWNTSNLSLTKTLYGADSIIYSIVWSPSSHLIAASASNGQVIIWSTETGKEVGRYEHHTKACFSMAWNQLQADVVASSSADCSVVIFEVNEDDLLQDNSSVPRGSQKNQQKKVSQSIIKMKVSLSIPVFGVNFSPTAANYLCVGSQDGAVRIFDYHLRSPLVCIMRGHSARVFNVMFSPVIPGLIASSSDDKNIHVWRVNLDELSNGDDGESGNKVKSIAPGTSTVLSGHIMHVRAIHWNSEYANILLSGSWDSTIRIWDTDLGECLRVIEGHAADVYSLVAHPVRPLSYISCSRDGTVRKWELEGFSRIALAQSVWDCSVDSCRSKDSDNDSGSIEKTNIQYKFSGKHSFILNHKLGPPKDVLRPSRDGYSVDERIDLAKKYYEMFNFFCGNNGSLDVWECALSLLIAEKTNSQPQPLPSAMLLRASSCRVILTRNELVLNAESDARKGDSVKASARGEHMSEKTKLQLNNAARMFARVGNYQKYCSIMIELGQYHQALAMAPCVSYEYWRELSTNYAVELAGKSNDMCVPFYMGVGMPQKAVGFYLGRNDLDGALITASKAEANAGIPSVRARTPPRTREVQVGSSRKSTFSSEINAAATIAMGLLDPKALVNTVCYAAADDLVMQGQPILAAAQHLSIGNTTDAVNVLVSCGEYELALALAVCFDLPQHNEARKLLAHRIAHQGNVDLAIKIIETLPRDDADNEKSLAINQLFDDEDASKTYLRNNGMRSRSSWTNMASEMEVMGSDDQSIFPLIMSRQYSRAVTSSLTLLRGFLRDPLELTSSAKSVLRALKFVKASLVDEKLRTSFLMHMQWFCAHEAAELGLWQTAASMLRKLRQNCAEYPFPIPREEIIFQEVFFSIFGGDKNSITKLNEIHDILGVRDLMQSLQEALRTTTDKFSVGTDVNKKDSSSQSVEISGSIYGEKTAEIRSLVIRLGDSMSLPSLAKLHLLRPGSGSVPVIPGSLLPSAHHFSSMYSCISGELIIGPAVKVDSMPGSAPEEGFASLSEVLGWSRVNPYEPGLTGEWIIQTSPPPIV